jgi:hypothetical protein
MRTKLYHPKCKQSAAQWLSHFLEKAFVKRVSLRIRIRMVKFWRPRWRCKRGGSESPSTGTTSVFTLVRL